jgi:hypothetical protein
LDGSLGRTIPYRTRDRSEIGQRRQAIADG